MVLKCSFSFLILFSVVLVQFSMVSVFEFNIALEVLVTFQFFYSHNLFVHFNHFHLVMLSHF